MNMAKKLFGGVLAAVVAGTGAVGASALEPVACVWREAEAFDDQFRALTAAPVPAASGGAVLSPEWATSTRNWAAYVVRVPRDMADAQIIVRYASTYPGVCGVLLEVDDHLPTDRPKLRLGPTGGAGQRVEEYGCAAVNVGPLPAGMRRIRLMVIEPVRAASTQPAEGSGETPTSLQEAGPSADGDDAGGKLQLDGFFVTDSTTAVPADHHAFVSLYRRTQLASDAGRAAAYAEAAKASPIGIVVASIDPWQSLGRADEFFPPAEAIADEVRLEAAGNEVVSGVVALTNMGDACEVMVSLDDSADAGQCQARVVGQYQSRWYGPVFDPLFSAEDLGAVGEHRTAIANWTTIADWPRLSLAPCETALVWLTWDTHGLEPGRYERRLTLRNGKGGEQVVPIRLEVTPASLPRDNPLLSYVFTPTTDCRERIVDMIGHGINVFRTNAYEDSGRAVPPEHRFALARGAKFFLFNYSPGWGLPPIKDAAHEERSRQCIRDILASAVALGLERDEWAVQLSDEPNAKHVAIIKRYVQLAREVDPAVRIWLDPGWSGNAPGSLAKSHGLRTFFEPLRDDIAVWCPFVGHLWRDDEPIYEFLRSTGAELWFYKNASIWSKEPRACFGWYRKVSWIAWKYQTRGAGLWNLAYYLGDPWDDFDKSYPDGAFTYAGENGGLIASRVYEAYRQGVQEYKRLWWLDRLLEAVSEQGGADVVGAVEKDRRAMQAAVDRAIAANSSAAVERSRRWLDERIVHWQQELSMTCPTWTEARWRVGAAGDE
jgi:hypothetical protein